MVDAVKKRLRIQILAAAIPTIVIIAIYANVELKKAETQCHMEN